MQRESGTLVLEHQSGMPRDQALQSAAHAGELLDARRPPRGENHRLAPLAAMQPRDGKPSEPKAGPGLDGAPAHKRHGAAARSVSSASRPAAQTGRQRAASARLDQRAVDVENRHHDFPAAGTACTASAS